MFFQKSTPRRPHSALASFTKRYTPFVEPKLTGLPANKQDQLQTKGKDLLITFIQIIASCQRGCNLSFRFSSFVTVRFVYCFVCLSLCVDPNSFVCLFICISLCLLFLFTRQIICLLFCFFYFIALLYYLLNLNSRFLQSCNINRTGSQELIL